MFAKILPYFYYCMCECFVLLEVKRLLQFYTNLLLFLCFSKWCWKDCAIFSVNYSVFNIQLDVILAYLKKNQRKSKVQSKTVNEVNRKLFAPHWFHFYSNRIIVKLFESWADLFQLGTLEVFYLLNDTLQC